MGGGAGGGGRGGGRGRPGGGGRRAGARVGCGGAARGGGRDEILDLLPVVRRVIAARVRDPHLVDDLVQETLTRIMTVRSRVEDGTLVPYAIVTARNLVASPMQGPHGER